MAKHKLFVYGTLRPGNTEPVELAGSLYDLGWFPGVKVSEGTNHKFVAEMIEVDDKELERLDQYEGYYEDSPETSLYLRQRYGDSDVWIYIYNHDVNPGALIEDGDWLKYTNTEKGRAA